MTMLADDPERKITPDELREMFGDTLPMEAIAVIWDGADTKTIGQCRAELRAIAARMKSEAPTFGEKVDKTEDRQ